MHQKEKTMTDNTTTDTNFDFNNAGEQRSFDVIPANTIVILQMTIRPGGAGDDGWLKHTTTDKGDSEYLDCEFTVVSPERYAKRKLWQPYTIRGTTDGHAEAGRISRDTLRAILESARGIRPDDKSAEAQNARNVSAGGWANFDQLRFVARLGVRPPQGGYPAKNTILQVITPGLQDWQKHKPNSASDRTATAAPAAAATTPPPGAIGRPQWGRGS
jgi:hypothetical protein